MMRIIKARGGYYVERKSRYGMAFGAGLLGVAWFVLCVPLMYASGWWGFVIFATLVLGVPALVLAVKSSRKRWKITAVIAAHQVAGGILLHVLDARQVTHQLLADEATAQGLASALTARTGIARA